MMKWSHHLLVALAFSVNISCQTVMNTGITGSERGPLQPYKNIYEKEIDFSFSGQLGSSYTLTTPDYLNDFIGSKFLKGNLSLQWQNMLKNNRFCGSASAHAWTGDLVNIPDGEYNQYISSESDKKFFGSAISLRLGIRNIHDSKTYSVPSVELLYAYEAGQYYALRKYISTTVLKELDSPINMKPERSSFVLSIIPYDKTFFGKRTAHRLSYALGWNNQWLQLVSDTVPDNLFMSLDTFIIFFPTNIGLDYSFQPNSSNIFFSVNGNITNLYIDNYKSSNFGISLGIGYLLK
ncbi:MAG: hypothetical protein ACYDEX_25800 [Mobilitalea sp.]